MRIGGVQLEENTERVYRYIVEFVREHRYPPTMRELARGCNLAVSSIIRHLDRLEWERRIARDPGRARGITVLADDVTPDEETAP